MKIPVLLHVMVLILKGIGFDLQDGSDYAGQFGLMTGGRVHEDDINHIAHYKENPLVQEAIEVLQDDPDVITAEQLIETIRSTIEKLLQIEDEYFYSLDLTSYLYEEDEADAY